MTKDQYIKIYDDFVRTSQLDGTIIYEFCREKDKDFNINEFMKALEAIENPFILMSNPAYQKYQGIDYQKIMIDACFKYFDEKFSIKRLDIDFKNVLDKRISKSLYNKYSSGTFVMTE
jgi:hypothetical protein